MVILFQISKHLGSIFTIKLPWLFIWEGCFYLKSLSIYEVDFSFILLLFLVSFKGEDKSETCYYSIMSDYICILLTFSNISKNTHENNQAISFFSIFTTLDQKKFLRKKFICIFILWIQVKQVSFYGLILAEFYLHKIIWNKSLFTFLKFLFHKLNLNQTEKSCL